MSPLMCINIGVIFGIIRMVRVRCDLLVSAAGLINNGAMVRILNGRVPRYDNVNWMVGHDM